MKRLEALCRNHDALSFKILDPDALIIPFTQPRATDLVIFESLDGMNQILCRPTVFLMQTGKLRDHLGMAQPEEEYEGFIGHDSEESLLRKLATKFSKEESGFTIPELEDVPQEETVSHELLHAAFVTDERLKRLVAEFWHENVTDADKRSIIATLESEGYEIKKNTERLDRSAEGTRRLHLNS